VNILLTQLIVEKAYFYILNCKYTKVKTSLTICTIISAAVLLLLFTSCQPENVSNGGKPDTSESVKNFNDLGSEQWRMGNYQEALKQYTSAYKEAKQRGDEESMATFLNNLGLVHWRLDNNEAAMECYTESAQFAEKLKLKRLLGLTLTNRSLILKEQRNFEKAFKLNNKAIELFKASGNHRDLAIAYNNQGQIYRFRDEPDASLKFYFLSLAECQEIDYKEGEATAWQNISAAYGKKGERKKAFSAAHKCLDLSQQLNSKVRTSEAYLGLSHHHEQFNHPDSALYYHKKYYEFEKNIMESNQSERLSMYQASLGIEVKNLRIQNLQNEQQMARNRLWFMLTGIVIALLVTGFFVYRYFTKMSFKKQQLELELYNSQQIISVKERELKTYIIDLYKKNTLITQLQEKQLAALPANSEDSIEVAQLLKQKILTDEDWEIFKTRFNSIYTGFFRKIKESDVPVSEAEIRILVLMRLKLNSKDMANILGISPQSVRVCKMRLKKKLLLKDFMSVEDFLKYLLT
jgi:tetratricopeptide (TPR) repeat protein